MAAAWLGRADEGTKSDHMCVRIPADERLIARLAFRETYGADWEALEARERERRPGEGEEPDE
eukprot:9499009-Pyramimonas_sp.AAC.1